MQILFLATTVHFNLILTRGKLGFPRLWEIKCKLEITVKYAV